MGRTHENDPQVVARVAESLRPRRETGIPEPELVAIAEREGVWAYQIMEALGLSNQGGVFLPKPPRKAEEEPVAEGEAAPQGTSISWTPARLGPPIPPAESSPGRRAALARAGTWEDRLRFAVAEQWGDATEWPNAEVVIPQARMEELGWPSSSWKHPAFWGATHEAGKTARLLGWDPSLRDGIGLRLRRRPAS